jgi:hypothetical protein
MAFVIDHHSSSLLSLPNELEGPGDQKYKGTKINERVGSVKSERDYSIEDVWKLESNNKTRCFGPDS